MDSSIRQDVTQGLLGGLSWKAEDVRPTEWVYVINEVLQKYSGIIDYLPGYHPIKKLLHMPRGQDYIETDLSAVTLEGGLSLETKCFYLAGLSHEVSGDAQEMHTSGYGCRFVHKRDLYFTHRGRTLLSDCRYERVFSSRTDKPGHTQVTETTRWWSFGFCEGDNLARIITSPIALNIIDSLGTRIRDGVRERRIRVRQMESFFRSLKGVKDKLGEYNSWQSLDL